MDVIGDFLPHVMQNARKLEAKGQNIDAFVWMLADVRDRIGRMLAVAHHGNRNLSAYAFPGATPIIMRALPLFDAARALELVGCTQCAHALLRPFPRRTVRVVSLIAGGAQTHALSLAPE